jgi:CHAT domain-containing protein
MKLLQLPIKITLVLIWTLISTPAVFAQSGNQSDITGPNPGETPSQIPNEETPTTTEETPLSEGETPTTTEETPLSEGETPTTTEETPLSEGETPTTTEETPLSEGETPTTTEETPLSEGETPTTTEETPLSEGETPTTTEETPLSEGETPTTTEETPLSEGETPTTTEETPLSEGETPNDNNTSDLQSEPTATEDSQPTTSETAEETPNDTESTASEDSQTDSEVAQEETPNDNESTASEDSQTDSEATQEKTPNDNESTASEDSQTDEKTDSESSETENNEEEESTARASKLTEDREKKATAEAEEEEQETAKKENSQSDLDQEVDRIAYEAQVQEAPPDLAMQMHEEFQLTELMESSGMQLYGTVPSVKDISQRLAELSEQTGKKAAFINISLQENQLESFVVLPSDTKSAASKNAVVASTSLNGIDSSQPQSLTLRKTVKDTSREELIATATQFRQEVSDVSKLSQANYMQSSQKLYQALIKPIEAELEANNIDILVFSMDSGLRLLPLAALNDGKQFLIEKYAVALVPSFGLTDTRYVNLNKSSILAMGASEFAEQAALPTMPVELETIVSKPRQGEVFINEQFTISNFKTQNSRQTSFPIIHLGTHAQFKTGDVDDSYIQFYDDKLRISQLQQLSDDLGWNSDATPVELLVLSACETAIGDQKAELGFAGLAVQAGVKSALASLWYVSDLGTLGLMGEFYDQLDGSLIKAEALRQTQLNMLHGNVKVDNQQVKLSNGKSLALPKDFPSGTLSLAHPYFWSSFTLIGNWN